MMDERRSNWRSLRDAIWATAAKLQGDPGQCCTTADVAHALTISSQRLHYHVLKLEEAGIVRRSTDGHRLFVLRFPEDTTAQN